MTQRTEIPTAAKITEVNMAAQQTGSAVQTDSGVLHMHVINAVNEICQEQMRRKILPTKTPGHSLTFIIESPTILHV